MSIQLPPDNIKCPYTAHKKKCKALALNCPKFISIDGKNPQTGADVREYGCSDTFLPMMIIENSQQQRQTAAAVESFRNEMVAANEQSQRVLLATAGMNSNKLIEGE